MNERGQVVIPKKVREAVHLARGDELEIKVQGDAIVLKPLKRFKAWKWRDYEGIGEDIVAAHIRAKKKGKTDEGVCSWLYPAMPIRQEAKGR